MFGRNRRVCRFRLLYDNVWPFLRWLLIHRCSVTQKRICIPVKCVLHPQPVQEGIQRDTAAEQQKQNSQNGNKNMVARILANTRYLGESGFPVLIDAAVFLDAEEKRKKKAPSVQKTDAQTVLRRKCGCRITPHIEHEVLYLLNCLARNPERIVTPQTPREHSQRLDALKAELEELISQLPVDENRAREVLREIAAEMYADIDPREYETQRMRRVFQKEEPRSELDANLIAMNISSVLVDSNGKVKIRLKNDQIVERGE